MKTIQLQIGLTLTDDAIKTLAEIIQQVTESMPRKMTKQESSQHALFGGKKPPEDRGLLINSREAAKLLCLIGTYGRCSIRAVLPSRSASGEVFVGAEKNSKLG